MWGGRQRNRGVTEQQCGRCSRWDIVNPLLPGSQAELFGPEASTRLPVLLQGWSWVRYPLPPTQGLARLRSPSPCCLSHPAPPNGMAEPSTPVCAFIMLLKHVGGVSNPQQAASIPKVKALPVALSQQGRAARSHRVRSSPSIPVEGERNPTATQCGFCSSAAGSSVGRSSRLPAPLLLVQQTAWILISITPTAHLQLHRDELIAARSQIWRL